MVRVSPVKGDPFECNMSHILSLRCTADHSKKYVKDAIINISVSEYLKQNDKFKHMMKLWRAGVDWPKAPCFDPYLAGLWLGDGHVGAGRSTNCEPEIHKWVSENSDASKP